MLANDCACSGGDVMSEGDTRTRDTATSSRSQRDVPTPGTSRAGTSGVSEGDEVQTPHNPQSHESLTLPLVYAIIACGASGPNDAFAPHSLLLDTTCLTLTSHTKHEQTHFPISAVFDILPIQQSDSGSQGLQVAPTPNLLQILTTSHHGQPVEFRVTLALPTLFDCTCIVKALTYHREALCMKESVRPDKVALPEPSATPGEGSMVRVSGGVTRFDSLYFQVLLNQGRDGQAVYHSCVLLLEMHGLVIRAGTLQAGLLAHSPWSVPWMAIVEVGAPDIINEDVRSPPVSHPHVLRIVVAVRVGLIGCSCSTINFAVETPARLELLLSSFKTEKDRYAKPFPLEKPDRGRPDIEVGPPRGRVSAELSSVAAPPAGIKDSEPTHVLHINDVVVPLTSNMANLLQTYQPADTEQPEPLNIGQVWVYVSPTFTSFQRSFLCVDKLGLTITPLIPATALPAGGRTGTRPVMDGGTVKDIALVTDSWNFPVSSVVDVAEESQFKLAVGDTEDQSASTPPPVDQKRQGFVGPRRAALPFARARQRGPQESTNDTDATPIAPPHPHLVGMRVKGALAGRVNAGEKTPVHLRLNSQPPPPVPIVLSFLEKGEATGFVTKMLAYKKYHLSLALSTYLNTVTAISQRQCERRGSRHTEDGVVAKRMQGQASVPSVEPPPLPPRPGDLPPANRLPRMVTNDDGEVFWYIPRKQGRSSTGATPGSTPTAAKVAAAAGSAEGQGLLGQPGCPGGRMSDEGRLSGGGSPLHPGAHPPPQPDDEQPETPPRAEGGGTPTTPTLSDKPHPEADFDDEMLLIDTPAPCLTSPIPSPGRP